MFPCLAGAFKFVVHLVGDAHQPLHCAERNNDKGGNTRLVFFLDQRKAENLHTVWDTLLLKEAMRGKRVAEYADVLDHRITPQQAKEWPKGTPEERVNETHRVALTAAYAGVPADGPPPKLGPEYVKANEKVVDKQLARAGLRLARLLNAISAMKAR